MQTRSSAAFTGTGTGVRMAWVFVRYHAEDDDGGPGLWRLIDEGVDDGGGDDDKVRTEGEEGGEVDGCLLYTSPSPRDRTRSRMPSSA